MIKFSVVVLMNCLVFSGLIAQNIIVSGHVYDKVSGDDLIGASVLDRTSGSATITDEQGQFTLELPRGSSSISVSYITFREKEVSLSADAFLEIGLDKEDIILDKVVITALNTTRNTRDLGYSIQSLNSEELNEVKSVNLLDNLAGRVAGVQINHGATGTGSTSLIRIRGESSFTNNNPLFVIDGIPINNNTIINRTNESASGFQEVDFGSGAMEISQDDIAEITVLKGPSSAALYGTRAANGVVLITTKKGRKSHSLGITLNSSTYFERPFRLPKFQNSYGQGNSGQFEYVDGLGGGLNDNISYSWGPRLDQGLLIPQFDSPVELDDGRIVRGGDNSVHQGATITPTAFNSHPDNLKDFYELGITTINNVALSHGGDNTSFRLSYTDLNNTSIIPGVDYKRNNISTSLTYKPDSKFSLSTNAHFIQSDSDNRPSSGYGSENINYSLVAWGPRSLNIDNLRDYWQPGLEDIQQYSFNYTFFDNPYFILSENVNSFNKSRILGQFSLRYNVFENFNLEVKSGLDRSDESRRFIRHFSTNRFRQGAYAEQEVDYNETNHSLHLNYTHSIGKLESKTLLGVNRMDQLASSKHTEVLSLAQPGVFNFSNGASALNNNTLSARKRINSLYGLLSFNYNRTIYLDVAGRNDWSSALQNPDGNGDISFFYPSFSLGYLIGESLDLPQWISYAKLRLSWAQVGNDTDPYQTSSAFVAGVPYNSAPTFTTQDAISNASIKPEIATSRELGIDLRFLNNRLRVDATYFNSLTRNQIVRLPVAISTGFNQQVINGGSVRNSGIEVITQFSAIQRPNFNYELALNFSQNRAAVESLPDGAERISLGYSRIYDNENQTVWIQVEEGGRIGDMYGTGYLRNDEGRFVVDENGNFIVDNDLQYLGNYNHDFSIGMTHGLTYKNWHMNILLDWRHGGRLVSRTLALAGVGGQLEETENRPDDGIIVDGVVNIGSIENPVWEENTKAITPESFYRQFYDRNHEENNTYNASYIKLREFSFGRSLLVSKHKKELNISLVGRNIWAWSAIPHFDPEQTALQGDGFVRGVEDMSYPSSRSLGIKLSLKL